MAYVSDMLSAAGVLGLGAVGWFGANFIGAPVIALRQTRQEALGVAGRYGSVAPTSSDELRSTAIKALNDAAAALMEQVRADTFAVRKYCDWFGYDIGMAAGCLRALTTFPQGEHLVTAEKQKITRDAVFVSLGATWGLSADEISAATEGIAEVRRQGAKRSKTSWVC